MKKIAPITAWAIVKKKNPKINMMLVFATKDAYLEDDEKYIKIKITPCRNS